MLHLLNMRNIEVFVCVNTSFVVNDHLNMKKIGTPHSLLIM